MIGILLFLLSQYILHIFTCIINSRKYLSEGIWQMMLHLTNKLNSSTYTCVTSQHRCSSWSMLSLCSHIKENGQINVDSELKRNKVNVFGDLTLFKKNSWPLTAPKWRICKYDIWYLQIHNNMFNKISRWRATYTNQINNEHMRSLASSISI
jgi:hypothetical protein